MNYHVISLDRSQFSDKLGGSCRFELNVKPEKVFSIQIVGKYENKPEIQLSSPNGVPVLSIEQGNVAILTCYWPSWFKGKVEMRMWYV